VCRSPLLTGVGKPAHGGGTSSRQSTPEASSRASIKQQTQMVTCSSPLPVTIYVLGYSLIPSLYLRCSLLGSGGVVCSFKPLANHDGDRPGDGHWGVQVLYE
jgi:hypothetical protein